jgi:hypothetical protein
LSTSTPPTTSPSTVLDLESSTSVKFSRHLIFTETIFRDNLHMGQFVTELARGFVFSEEMCSRGWHWITCLLLGWLEASQS